MTEREYGRHTLVDYSYSRSSWQGFKENLKSLTPAFLVITLMSQWYIAYYAADYYAHQPRQQGINLDAIKAHAMKLGDSKVMGLNLGDLESLLTFDCKK